MWLSILTVSPCERIIGIMFEFASRKKGKKKKGRQKNQLFFPFENFMSRNSLFNFLCVILLLICENVRKLSDVVLSFR